MITGPSLKQQYFITEYVKDRNATQAAIRAGYSPRSAHNQAYRLMRNDEVQRCLYDLTEKSVSAISDALEDSNNSLRLKAATLAINILLSIEGIPMKKYL